MGGRRHGAAYISHVHATAIVSGARVGHAASGVGYRRMARRAAPSSGMLRERILASAGAMS
jgi:hypothetical protein